ncbi:MAG: hypothetical protein MUP36_02180 [Demequinaceae bacterium]|nr:hypothetical protein [Demequinaceae bacterium]
MRLSPIVPTGGDSTIATFSIESVLIAALGLFAIGITVLVVRYFRLRIPGFGLGDRFRSFMYLARFSNGLLFRGIGDKERRSRTLELRANLAEAAAAEGMARAIQRLGSPRRLAASVVEGRTRPTWVNGIIAGLVASFLAVLFHGILIDTWVTAAEVSGAETVNGTIGLLPGATFTYEQGGDYTITSIWLLIIPVVAFLLWARPWRLFLRDGARASTGV